MNRIRILHLISGAAIGDQSGGAELHALQAARHIDKTKFDPVIYAAWRFDSPSEIYWLDSLSQEGIAVEGLSPWTADSPSYSRGVFRDLWTTVKRLRPQIIHSHSERYDSLNWLLRISHPVHPRAVRTIHLDRQWQSRPRVGRVVNSLLFPPLFSFEAAVSQAIYQQLLESRLRSEKKIGLCYNGIDASAFQHRPVAIDSPLPDGFPPERPRVGIVGRLTDQKGHADLISAMQLVNQQLPAHLVIVGDGPLRAQLVELSSRLKIERFVHFCGTSSNIWEIWPHLDLFVLPSLWEGFPTVLLEAMSQEVPVVATDIPGNRELVKNGATGRLVPPGNPAILAEVILAALDDPAASDIIAKQAKETASKYTIQNTSKCYAELYQRILHQ